MRDLKRAGFEAEDWNPPGTHAAVEYPGGFIELTAISRGETFRWLVKPSAIVSARDAPPKKKRPNSKDPTLDDAKSVVSLSVDTHHRVMESLDEIHALVESIEQDRLDAELSQRVEREP